MRQKLLSVVVASALGLGAADYGQAAEGVKAYARFIVTDFRAEIEGQLVGDAGGVVSGTASTNAILSNDNFPPATPPLFIAEPGAANTAIGIFNADQACIDSLGQNDISPPCPVEDPEGESTESETGSSYAQVGDFPDIVLDVAQGDNRMIPSPGPADEIDDVYAVAQCQRSLEGALSKTGEGGSATSIRDIFTVPVESPLLELVGNFDAFVEARLTGTDAFEEPTVAIAATFLDFTIINSASETVSCDTSALSLSAVATLGNRESEDSFASLPGAPARLPCAADGSTGGTGFDGGVWDPDDTYRVFVGLGTEAACDLATVPGGGFKWYFAKNNRSPRLPRPIVTGLVVTDQFGTQTVNVRQLVGLMNPAAKDGAGPPSSTDHLSCYLLARVSPDPVVPGRVRITTDNFGEEEVRLRRGPVLCGPAIKTDEDGNSQGSLDGTYYQCYRATGGQPQRDITLSDQFFSEKPHALTGMSRVCAPASLGAGTLLPDDPHLACYEFPRASQALDPRIGVELFDPFMVDAGFAAPGVPVTVEREERFCEEATKERL